MSKPVTIIGWILLGAGASSLGIGYFLHAANADRGRLAEKIVETQSQLEQIQKEQADFHTEANKKLQDASQQVTQMQEALARYQKEQALMATATQLTKPDPWTLRTWQSTFSIPLGVSLRVPPGNIAVPMDQSLALENNGVPWLNLETYSTSGEDLYLTDLLSPETVTYLSNGRVLTGHRGKITSSHGTVYVMRVDLPNSSLLIWAKTGGNVTDKLILQALATLDLRS